MNYSRDLINKYGSKNRVDWNSWCVEKEKQHRFLYQVKTSIESKEEKQTLSHKNRDYIGSRPALQEMWKVLQGEEK